MNSVSKLKAVKHLLGPVTFLDLTKYRLETAHRELGVHVRRQVHQILCNRLNHLDDDSYKERFRQVRDCYVSLVERSTSPRVSLPIRLALEQYLRCLAAWVEGTALAGLNYPRKGILVDRQPVTPRDLALFLQHDNTGCQTGLYRLVDGSVVLWHSEEDADKWDCSRFDQLRVAVFQVVDEKNPVQINAFIYPDLLPGSAFGWRSDSYVQAVDSLILKHNPQMSGGILANVATWIALRLGPTVDRVEVLEALRPFYDGYASNTVYTRDGIVSASKYEFAADYLLPYELAEQPGSFLFQVNVFSDPHNADLRALENLSPAYRKVFEQRIVRTRQALQRRKPDDLPTGNEMDFFFNLLASRAGGEWAYANADVKAYFVSRVSSGGMQIWLGHGPALRREPPVVIHP